MTSSLYIHIPFCVSKCAYCDFHSRPIAPSDPAIERYLDGLLVEISGKIRNHGVLTIPSVYIGGGTPSMLGARGIARLLSFITENLAACLTPDCEVTVEVNPDSIDAAFLETCKRRGATRISIGIQTFNDACRAKVNRQGSGKAALEKLALLRGVFPSSFSADLISGLPGQTRSILAKDIETLLASGPPHISLYDLMPHGAMSGLLSEEERAALWLGGRGALLKAGYEQYEVSNFARPQARSAHNIRYWRMQNWIGAGEAASGTIIDDDTGTGFRETAGRVERLDSPTLIKETLLMGFRFIEGPDAALFRRRFGKTIEETIPCSLATWRAKGVVRKDAAAPSPQGLLFLDSFLRDCFAELSPSRTA
jgi:oxygen-independent coproporphyrinogen-3 oxidase